MVALTSSPERTNDICESRQTLVDVDGLLESVLVVAGAGGSQPFRTSEIDKVKDTLCTSQIPRASARRPSAREQDASENAPRTTRQSDCWSP